MNINLIAPINTLGYGISGLHIVDELIKLGHKVALFPFGNPTCHPRHEASIREALQNADEFDVNAPCIRLWHQHDMSMFVGKGRHIGFPIFELDTFTAKEKHHLTSCDELFVCSQWAQGVIEEMGEKLGRYPEIKVVPLGVDSEVFYPTLTRRKPTIFLNVGKWEIRKGHDVLLKAFQTAFTPEANVELWMMCDNPFPQAQEFVKEITAKYKNNPLSDKIRILPRVETDEQVAEIMRQADCGVFPSRAEGWNLEAHEMLACGKQVIATDYSAHTEFLTEENARLVPIYGVEPASDGVWFNKQGNWGVIDTLAMDILVDRMREVHDLKQNGDLRLNIKGIETAQKYSWKNTASTIVEHLCS